MYTYIYIYTFTYTCTYTYTYVCICEIHPYSSSKIMKFGNVDQDLKRISTKHRDSANQRPQGPGRIEIKHGKDGFNMI